MILQCIYAVLVAFIVLLILGRPAIRLMHQLRFGQTVRQEGPKTHLKKTGTPNMGGILIIFATFVAVLLFAGFSTDVLYALLISLGYGLIGFLDDLIKAVKRRSLGLKARHKLVGQLILGIVLALYLLNSRSDLSIYIPFTDRTLVLAPWMAVVLVILVLTGSSNAVNLTDGLDGLAAGTSAIAAVAYALICLALGANDLAVFASAIVGACLGFIWFNSYPAQVIMGDSGAFFLGAAFGVLSILTRTELFLAIIGGVFVIEALSDIIQVTYFRLTGGKRIFRMAPIHHHFELVGWPETKVVFRFWLIGFVFALLGLAAIVPLLQSMG